MFSLICVWINGWVNNREAGDLRRHRGHYDVIVMQNLALTKYSTHTLRVGIDSKDSILCSRFSSSCPRYHLLHGKISSTYSKYTADLAVGLGLVCGWYLVCVVVVQSKTTDMRLTSQFISSCYRPMSSTLIIHAIYCIFPICQIVSNVLLESYLLSERINGVISMQPLMAKTVQCLCFTCF